MRNRNAVGTLENEISQIAKLMVAVPAAAAARNPYLTQLVEGLRREGIQVSYWTPRRALFGTYDVVHVHWPELLYKGRSRQMTLTKSAVTLLLLLKWRWLKVPLVWTVHNQEPHNGLSSFAALMDKLVRKQVRAAISINDSGWVPPDLGTASVSTIPHGHYVDWYEEYAKSESKPMAACFVGQIRSYKGVVELVEEFKKISDPQATLCVAGAPSPARLGTTIADAARSDHRISVNLSFLSDEDLVACVTTSSLVILPYKKMFNSGALLLALSLNRTVLAPDTPTNKILQQEFGEEWIRLYSGPLAPQDIEAAMRVESARPLSPKFERREWSTIAREHLSVYEDVYTALNGRARIERRQK